MDNYKTRLYKNDVLLINSGAVVNGFKYNILNFVAPVTTGAKVMPDFVTTMITAKKIVKLGDDLFFKSVAAYKEFATGLCNFVDDNFLLNVKPTTGDKD